MLAMTDRGLEHSVWVERTIAVVDLRGGDAHDLRVEPTHTEDAIECTRNLLELIGPLAAGGQVTGGFEASGDG